MPYGRRRKYKRTRKHVRIYRRRYPPALTFENTVGSTGLTYKPGNLRRGKRRRDWDLKGLIRGMYNRGRAAYARRRRYYDDPGAVVPYERPTMAPYVPPAIAEWGWGLPPPNILPIDYPYQAGGMA